MVIFGTYSGYVYTSHHYFPTHCATTQAGDWPIDFATYLRRVQPPVDVEDGCRYQSHALYLLMLIHSAGGTVSISLLLAHERVRKLERRFITAVDLQRWPKISYDGAGIPSMSPSRFSNSPDTPSNFPTKWPYLQFPDPSTRSDTLVITPFAESPDGMLLAAIEGTLSIVVWRLSDGLTVQRIGAEGHTGAICATAFSPDSRSLVSVSTDRMAIVWSVQTGQPILRLRGHRATVEMVVYTANGSLIVTGSSDATVKFWNAVTGAPLGSFHHRWQIEGFLLSHEGSKLAVRLQEGVALYETSSRGFVVQLGVVETPYSVKAPIAAFSPDGSRLFINENLQRHSRIYTNTRIFTTDNCRELIRFEQFPEQIIAGVFSPDGAKLATLLRGGVTSVWDATNRKPQLEWLPDIDGRATAVAFSPNGAFFATAAAKDGMVYILVWNWESKVFVGEFTAPASEVEDMKFLPDNRRLLTFAKGGPACLWNVADVLRLR